MHIEVFIKEKLNPIHRLWYAIWVYWWPAWRTLFSGKSIINKWTRFNLIKEGNYFLDYGCGTGDFTIPAAKIVGDHGKIFALDCNVRQIKITEKRVKKAGITNVQTILTEKKTDLPGGTIDVVWMCDVLHEIRNKREVLIEVNRLLKKNGVLLVYDGMKEKTLAYIDGLFRLEKQDGKLLKLAKVEETRNVTAI